MTPPFHRAVVLEAVARYELYLENLAVRQPHMTIVRPILEALRTARRDGPRMQASGIGFDTGALERLSATDRRRLLNQFALGLGRDDAPVVVMGTEQAFELDERADLVNFCLENIASHIVWLAHGDSSVVSALSQNQVVSSVDRPFHIHPNDHYQEGGGHTWGRLARVLGDDGAHEPAAEPGLGHFCYQLDASAYPSQRADAGLPPTNTRMDFLVTSALPSLATTARVLILHGSSIDGDHRDRLARAFLGLPGGNSIAWRGHLAQPGRPLAFFDHNARRVIATRALANQGVTLDFLRTLRELVANAGTNPPTAPPVVRRRRTL